MRHCLLAVVVLFVSAAAGCSADREPSGEREAASQRDVVVYDGLVVHGRPRVTPVSTSVKRTGHPAVDAVTALLEHKPTHGHASAWSGMCAPGAGVRSVHVTKQLVTVDLEGFAPDAPGNASCDLSMTGWTMQRQQVGWTIRTAIGSRAPVKVTTGGDYRVMRPITAQRRYLAS